MTPTVASRVTKAPCFRDRTRPRHLPRLPGSRRRVVRPSPHHHADRLTVPREPEAHCSPCGLHKLHPRRHPSITERNNPLLPTTALPASTLEPPNDGQTGLSQLHLPLDLLSVHSSSQPSRATPPRSAPYNAGGKYPYCSSSCPTVLARLLPTGPRHSRFSQ